MKTYLIPFGCRENNTQTGAGLIQGFVERVEGTLAGPAGQVALNRPLRALLIAIILGVSAAFSSLGIVTLIGEGYSLLALGFGLVYILPLLVRGWRYFKLG